MKIKLRFLWGIILVFATMVGLLSCLEPLNFDLDKVLGDLSVSLNITNDYSAALLLTNKSKTVDVKNVTITRPASRDEAADTSISFDNQPKRLTKKAQYLAPTDQDYTVIISYEYFYKNDPNRKEGEGSKTLTVQLPFTRMIVEVFIFRDKNGNVVVTDKDGKNMDTSDPVVYPQTDPNDTGNPTDDPLLGEGSSPAIIPPDNRNKMGTFVVINMTNSQMIDNVNFKMGQTSYTMGRIAAHDKQSIALGQGSWETRLAYTRENIQKTLGPLNSIIVPSNDPQAIKEHYLYFYLTKRGDYAISQTWPPSLNDANEEDLLPMDNGYGRGLVQIINNTYAMAKTVTVQNLRDTTRFPYTIFYDKFTPAVPVQYNKIGFVDLVGTQAFPIEGHEDYLIQVTMELNNNSVMIERKAYIKDQVVTITINSEDLNFNKAQGAKVTLENKTSAWPVEITNLAVRNKTNTWQSSYYTSNTWEPNGSIAQNRSANQYVMSSTAMPITRGAEFEAVITIYGYGLSETITKSFSPAALYSELSPDQNARTITITDSDVPQSIKDAAIYFKGAKVTLENKVSTWPVEIIGMTVRNKSSTAQSTYYGASTWQPGILIGGGQSATQTVMSSTAMPISPGAQFEALIVINGCGKTETIIKPFSPAVLYSDLIPEQNTRTLTITDSDIPKSIQDAYIYTRGAKFTIENATDQKPVQIIGVAIKNKINPIQYTFYGESDWAPHKVIDSKGNATFMVNSTVDMPITQTAEFDAVVFIFANNTTVGVNKSFSPSVLYSDLSPIENTRSIKIEDKDVPSELEPIVIVPPIPTTKGATVTLENNIRSWPVQIIGMTVQNKADHTRNASYDRYTWDTHNQIDRNSSAIQMVYASTAMPIGSGDQFEAVITLKYNATTATVTKDFTPDTKLYSTSPPDQNFRKITIVDTDVPQTIIDAYNLTRGATVTIDNQVKTWPIQITEMVVRNIANYSQSTSYGTGTWTPKTVITNGQKVVQTVSSSNVMPISPGVQFEAVITIMGNNGQSTTVIKQFSPAELYSNDDPARNTRTITITDSDIPISLQTPPPYETGVPGLNGSTPIGDTVKIDGFEWYVADKTVIGGKTYTMLVCKVIMEYGVVFNSSRDSKYDGSNLQARMTGLYNRMVKIKEIAVIPNLGDHSPAFITQPTTTMAGTKIIDIFFALTFRDVKNLGDQAYRYGDRQYWTRSPITWESAYEVNCDGDIIGPAVTNATGIGAVPGVWVRAE